MTFSAPRPRRTRIRTSFQGANAPRAARTVTGPRTRLGRPGPLIDKRDPATAARNELQKGADFRAFLNDTVLKIGATVSQQVMADLENRRVENIVKSDELLDALRSGNVDPLKRQLFAVTQESRRRAVQALGTRLASEGIEQLRQEYAVNPRANDTTFLAENWNNPEAMANLRQEIEGKVGQTKGLNALIQVDPGAGAALVSQYQEVAGQQWGQVRQRQFTAKVDSDKQASIDLVVNAVEKGGEFFDGDLLQSLDDPAASQRVAERRTRFIQGPLLKKLKALTEDSPLTMGEAIRHLTRRYSKDLTRLMQLRSQRPLSLEEQARASRAGDVLAIMAEMIETDELSGVANATNEEGVTLRELFSNLGSAFESIQYREEREAFAESAAESSLTVLRNGPPKDPMAVVDRQISKLEETLGTKMTARERLSFAEKIVRATSAAGQVADRDQALATDKFRARISQFVVDNDGEMPTMEQLVEMVVPGMDIGVLADRVKAAKQYQLDEQKAARQSAREWVSNTAFDGALQGTIQTLKLQQGIANRPGSNAPGLNLPDDERLSREVQEIVQRSLVRQAEAAALAGNWPPTEKWRLEALEAAQQEATTSLSRLYFRKPEYGSAVTPQGAAREAFQGVDAMVRQAREKGRLTPGMVPDQLLGDGPLPRNQEQLIRRVGAALDRIRGVKNPDGTPVIPDLQNRSGVDWLRQKLREEVPEGPQASLGPMTDEQMAAMGTAVAGLNAMGITLEETGIPVSNIPGTKEVAQVASAVPLQVIPPQAVEKAERTMVQAVGGPPDAGPEAIENESAEGVQRLAGAASGSQPLTADTPPLPQVKADVPTPVKPYKVDASHPWLQRAYEMEAWVGKTRDGLPSLGSYEVQETIGLVGGSASIPTAEYINYEKPGRGDSFQPGMDMDFADGQFRIPVAGQVINAGWGPRYGNWVAVRVNRNGQEIDLLFGHLGHARGQGVNVTKGQRVAPGTVIGQVGSTGNVISSNGRVASLDILAPSDGLDMTPAENWRDHREWLAGLYRSGRTEGGQSLGGVGAGATDGRSLSLVQGHRLVQQLGFPARGTAYLAGNLMQESSFWGNRTWDDVGTPAGGLVSWHGKRLQKIESQYLGKPIEQATRAEQLQAMMEEMRNEYPSAYRTFMDPNASHAELEAASEDYWRWGELGDRFKYARQLLQ